MDWLFNQNSKKYVLGRITYFGYKELKMLSFIFKSEAFLQIGSVRTPRTDCFFVNLGMLESSYRFQTLHGVYRSS